MTAEADLIDQLTRATADPQFGRIADQALKLISASSKVTRSADTMRSHGIADIWELRRKMEYYKADAVLGVEETIARLRVEDIDVRLVVAECVKGIIALWLAEAGALAGLIVFIAPAE